MHRRARITVNQIYQSIKSRQPIETNKSQGKYTSAAHLFLFWGADISSDNCSLRQEDRRIKGSRIEPVPTLVQGRSWIGG